MPELAEPFGIGAYPFLIRLILSPNLGFFSDGAGNMDRCNWKGIEQGAPPDIEAVHIQKVNSVKH